MEDSTCKVVTSVNDIYEFQVMAALFGLSFPESATEFQMAAITLAYLSKAVHDIVLRGHDVPVGVCNMIHALGGLVEYYQNEQR